MTVVLDTNALVAALVAKGLCHEVVVRALGACTVVTSTPLLDELERTLRDKFTPGPAANAFLQQLRVRVRIVEPKALASPVSRDADDDVVLATAVAARQRSDWRPGPAGHRWVPWDRHPLTARVPDAPHSVAQGTHPALEGGSFPAACD